MGSIVITCVHVEQDHVPLHLTRTLFGYELGLKRSQGYMRIEPASIIEDYWCTISTYFYS